MNPDLFEMGKKPLLSVIIPVFNEKKSVLKIIGKVQELNISKEIIVVDDFSNDGTRKVLEELHGEEGMKFVFLNKNHGKGFAIRKGLEKISGEIVIIQDGDLEYDPGDYYKLVELIVRGKYGVVYGNRFESGRVEGISNLFYYGNKFLTFLTNLLFRVKLSDMETCYKVFKSEVIKGLCLRENRFAFEPEVTAKVLKKGYKILEVPINYFPRSDKEGKKIKLRDGFRAVWVLGRERFFD